MTDQDIRSELRKLYISLAFISSGSNILGGLFNSDAEEQDSSAVSKEMMYLFLKLFLLYVANGNSRITARQFAYIDDMVDHEMISVKMTASDLMARMPAFDEDPPYPREIMDALIQKDLMSKWIRPDEKPEEVTRCVRVYLELGRGVISLDKNAASMKRYREFMQATCRYAIRSGNGNYTAADFAFVYEALESLSAANVAGTASSAKVKAPAGKSMVGCVRAASIEGVNAFPYRVITKILPGSGEYDFNGPVPENILHRVMQTAIKNLISYGSNFLSNIDSTKDYNVDIMSPISPLPDLPAELAAMLSFYSAIAGQPVSEDLIVLGSIDMDGALVAPKEVDKQLQLCAVAGVKRVLLPVNAAASIKEIPSEFELVYFSTPQEALSKVFESETTPAAVAKKAPAKKSASKKTTTTQKKPAQSKAEKPTQGEAEKTAKPTAAKKAEPDVELMTEDGYVLLGKGKRNIREKQFAGRLDLERVEIAHGIKKICREAFQGCANLKSIRLPDTLKIIEPAAFIGSGLTELEIPNGVEELGPSSTRKEYYGDAFRGMEKLQTLSLPDSIEKAGGFGILEFEQFKCLTMSRAVAEKLSGDRYMAKHLEKVHVTDASDEERDIIIRAMEKDGTLRLKGATVIERSAFSKRDDLVRVVIPEGVTEIGRDAFGSCKNLKEVILPQSLAVIGQYAFYSCESMQAIQLPENLIEIGLEAFSGCKKLRKIELPQNLRKLGADVFLFCDSLHELVIPKSVEYMGKSIFGFFDERIDRFTILGTPRIDEPDDFEYRGVKELRITQAFYNQHKEEKWLKGRYNELVIIKPTEAPYISQVRQSAPAASAYVPRHAGSSGSAPTAPKVADPNADRRKQLEAQIRSLEAERDAVRGIFGGMKRRKLQSQIDELRAELRRLS